MNCLRCAGAKLVHESYESVPIDRCPKCQGIWLDSGELPEILNAQEKSFSTELIRDTLRKARAGVPPQGSPPVPACPKCAQKMKPLNFSYSSGVIVDVCSEHGIWFDHEELERVQAFHESWEAKKADIRDEFKSSLDKEARAYFESYDHWRKQNREKTFIKYGLFYWMDRLQHEMEKKGR